MQSLPAFFERTEVADFRWKGPDFMRAWGVCHVIHVFFGYSLVNV